jgi:hypothetical protein
MGMSSVNGADQPATTRLLPLLTPAAVGGGDPPTLYAWPDRPSMDCLTTYESCRILAGTPGSRRSDGGWVAQFAPLVSLKIAGQLALA